MLTTSERIETSMIVCTVGTETHSLIKSLDLPLEKGRLPYRTLDDRIDGVVITFADRGAYFRYLNEGSPNGRDVQHWLEAEAHLKAEISRVQGFDN
jgi:hypothetical protein